MKQKIIALNITIRTDKMLLEKESSALHAINDILKRMIKVTDKLKEQKRHDASPEVIDRSLKELKESNQALTEILENLKQKRTQNTNASQNSFANELTTLSSFANLDNLAGFLEITNGMDVYGRRTKKVFSKQIYYLDKQVLERKINKDDNDDQNIKESLPVESRIALWKDKLKKQNEANKIYIKVPLEFGKEMVNNQRLYGSGKLYSETYPTPTYLSFIDDYSINFENLTTSNEKDFIVLEINLKQEYYERIITNGSSLIEGKQLGSVDKFSKEKGKKDGIGIKMEEGSFTLMLYPESRDEFNKAITSMRAIAYVTHKGDENK